MRRSLGEILIEYRVASAALHKLWTADVGTLWYDKKTWQAISNNLDRSTRELAEAAGHPIGAPL